MADSRRGEKSKSLRAVLLLAAIATAAVAQSSLDAPGEKTVTVGSEISRGAKTITGKAREHVDIYLEDLDRHMREDVLRATAENSDSPGFMLGARFGQWFMLDLYIKLPASRKVANFESDFVKARERAKQYFDDMRVLQKSLQISDEELFGALGLTGASAAETRSLIAEYGPRLGESPTPATPEGNQQSVSPTPLPKFPPLPSPELVKLTKDFVVVDSKGRDVGTLAKGKRLRVIHRDQTGILVEVFGDKVLIPADITEPSK